MTAPVNDTEERILDVIGTAIRTVWAPEGGADGFPSTRTQAEAILHALYDEGYIVMPDETVANLYGTVYKLRSAMQRALYDSNNYVGP
jgi:hypothetical protein